MTDFSTWYKNTREAATKTPSGEQFAANNFTVWHTGGGCLAWGRMIDDTGCYVMITDSSGVGIEVDPKLGDEDFWMVGTHGPDGEFTESVMNVRTVEAALAEAERQHKVVVEGKVKWA